MQILARAKRASSITFFNGSALGFSLQANAKTREGGKHPDRNAQFEHINALVTSFNRRASRPSRSILRSKKKENVGDFKNAGRTLRPKGDPEPVRVHDFIIKVSAWIMIPPASRLRASGAGGTDLAGNAPPTRDRK